MSYQIGDKVALLNEASKGKVIAVLENSQFLVLLDDGIEIPVPMNDLVKIKDFKSNIYISIPKEPNPVYKKKNPETTSANQSSILDKHRRDNGNIEVDLHAEELLQSQSGMSNTEILNYQIRYFQKCLDEAIAKRIYKIIFIHGVGNGVLRKEIHKILQAEGHEFYDASLSRFGFGATTVVLK
jgi:dsDNA-specific endonuclease/ATPase MutS2